MKFLQSLMVRMLSFVFLLSKFLTFSQCLDANRQIFKKDRYTGMDERYNPEKQNGYL